MSRILSTFTTAVLLFAVCSPVDAATILIDWGGTGTGGVVAVANPAGDGKHWNSLGANGADPNNAALIDSTGASTPVTVTVPTGGGTGSGWGGFSGTVGADPYDEAKVHVDGLFNANNTPVVPITFNGLLANTEYSFTAISRRSSGTGRDGKITITTGTSTDIGSGIVLALNGSVLSFNATSDASGIIALGFADNTTSSGGAVMSGMTITGDFVAVPEPSSLALLSLGAFGLLLRRR